MIEQEKRKAVYQLHLEGVSIRKIACQLRLSRNTVRTIIAQNGAVTQSRRSDCKKVDTQLLCHLWKKCDGRIQRIYEILTEEEEIQIGYSTLTRLLRELDLGQRKKRRSHHVEDIPGQEMQHDTSPYRLIVGNRQVQVVASLLYFRYSKMRYLKFYRYFNRFCMKCFLHEALSYFGHTARHCIIDNTNLARLRGSGKYAVMVPEMAVFSREYGFEFICHEIGHANRKAGNERSFYTVETNFFPGRRFDSFGDLNQQALEWATRRMAQRPVSKSGLIPANAFEYEQSYLIKLPPYIHPPYLLHERLVDQYGYASFDGNYYWVPELSASSVSGHRNKVRILQYSDCIKIYQQRKLLVQYPLPPDGEGVKNQRFSPPGQSPPYQPRYRKKPTAAEEKKLRVVSKRVDDYLNFALKQSQTIKQKHRFIRQLYGLYQKLALPLFIKTVERALKYRITSMAAIEEMATLLLTDGNYRMPTAVIDEDFKNRESYLEGCISDQVDLSEYDRLLEKEEEK
jgi:transposase